MPAYQVPGSLGVHIAGDDHGHIARVVVSPVIGQAVVQGHTLEILVPADDRPGVRMLSVGGGVELLLDEPEGVVHTPEFSFADHHLPLGLEIFLVQLEAAQTVGLQAQGQVQMLGRQIFEIGGVVLGGKGIDFAPLGLELAGKLLGAQILRTPEHEVLEEVADTGDTRELMSGADLVMELHRNHRHRLVGEHKKGETVVQVISNYGDGGIPG